MHDARTEASSQSMLKNSPTAIRQCKASIEYTDNTTLQAFERALSIQLIQMHLDVQVRALRLTL
jgi:hypothetical protein